MELYVNPQITGFRQDVDGTIKELKIGSNKEDAYANIVEQGGGKKLDNNKTATINVSTYTEPVEILPTEGKDGMKKATITLSNIPSPGTSVTFYYWQEEGETSGYYTLSETPSVDNNVYAEADSGNSPASGNHFKVKSIGEGTITIELVEEDITLERTPEGDITYRLQSGASVVG